MKTCPGKKLKSTTAVFVCLALLCIAVGKDNFILNPEPLEYEQPGIAAYFGETEKLRALLGDQASVDAGIQKGTVNLSALAGWAVEGRRFEILDLLVSYGWPRYPEEVAALFSQPDADSKAMAEVAARVPNFNAKSGEWCLREAVSRGGRRGIKWLLDAGVRPGQYGPQMLMGAMRLRDVDLLKLLIAAGADPEAKTEGMSAVDAAARIRSAKMLAAVDSRGRYADLLAELQRDYTPPKDSHFTGNWVWRPSSGGFGTLQVILFDDGSATVLTDVVGGAGVWRGEGNRVRIQFLDERGNLRKDQSLELDLKDNCLALPPPPTEPGAKERRLVRVETLPEVAHPSPQHPRYMRLEAAGLDAEKRLWLQINGRHQKVALAQLVDAAQTSSDPSQPLPKNMLSWADFVAGAIPATVTKVGVRVALVSKFASPAYRGDKLAHDHDHVTLLPEGVEIAIFPSGQERLQDETTGSTGEYPVAFAIMSRSPLSHGKDWVRVFIRRSTKNPE